MTQAIMANSIDLNTAVINDRTNTAADKTIEFNNVLNKELADKQNTIGDIKNSLLKGDLSNNLADFKEFLAKATEEANMEKSLDLTLARDIGDIISQLKNVVSRYCEDLQSEQTSLTTEKEINEEREDKSILFEQVLTMIDKLIDTNNTAQEEIAIETDTEIQTEIVSEEAAEFDVQKTTEKINDKVSDLELDADLLKELNIESIKADSSKNDTDFMQKQSPEEYGVKALLNQNIDNINFNFNEIQADKTQVKPTEISTEKIIEQITKQLDSLRNNTKVNIVLNPESLGKVDIQLINTKEGLSAQFTVTTQEARELIMKGLDGLKESLLTQGMNVDNISVKVSETEETAYNADWTEQEGSRGGNKDQNNPEKQEKEKGLFEKTIAQSLIKEELNT